MRDSKWYVMVVWLLCVALLAGCSQTEEAPIGTLTKEQALADYDYMWEVLEDNYPSFHVAERMYGVNKERVKHLNRVSLDIYPAEEIPLMVFFNNISTALGGIGGGFHLSLVSPEGYENFILELKDHDIGRNITQYITDWDKSANVYDYIEEQLTVNTNYPIPDIEDNLSFEIIDNHTVLITIRSFAPSYEDPNLTMDDITAIEKERLLNYYKQAAGYDNLIIDISNNSGGNDLYWISGIVSPNLTDEVTVDEVFLFKAGQENVKYLESLGLSSDHMERIEESELIQSLPGVNEADMKELDYVVSVQHPYQPESDRVAFAGDIYVLIDKPVYSSSESFARFCKKTSFATLVGRISGGDGGGGVSPLFISLPESGLIFRYSPIYTINEDGSSNQEFGTTPDYISADDETPLETALRVIEMRRGE